VKLIKNINKVQSDKKKQRVLFWMIDGKNNEIPGVYIDETPKLAMIKGGNPEQIKLLPLKIVQSSKIKEFLNEIFNFDKEFTLKNNYEYALGT
jgi:hypothetical protein